MRPVTKKAVNRDTPKITLRRHIYILDFDPYGVVRGFFLMGSDITALGAALTKTRERSRSIGCGHSRALLRDQSGPYFRRPYQATAMKAFYSINRKLALIGARRGIFVPAFPA